MKSAVRIFTLEKRPISVMLCSNWFIVHSWRHHICIMQCIITYPFIIISCTGMSYWQLNT